MTVSPDVSKSALDLRYHHMQKVRQYLVEEGLCAPEEKSALPEFGVLLRPNLCLPNCSRCGQRMSFSEKRRVNDDGTQQHDFPCMPTEEAQNLMKQKFPSAPRKMSPLAPKPNPLFNF